MILNLPWKAVKDAEAPLYHILDNKDKIVVQEIRSKTVAHILVDAANRCRALCGDHYPFITNNPQT